MPSRVLSEQEFEAIKAKVLKMAPKGLDEQGFAQWADRMGRNLMVSEIAEAEQKPAPLAGDALQRFFGGLTDTVVGAVKGTAGLIGAMADPTPEGFVKRANVGESILSGSEEQAGKAAQAYREGRYSEAFGHGAGVIPLLTPAAQAGEQIGSGDIAGGLGRGTGQIGMVVGPELVAKGGRAVRDAVAGTNVVPVAKAVASDVFPRTARAVRRLAKYHETATADAPTPAPTPDVPVVTPQPTHPLAQQMAEGNANRQASQRMVRGMSESATPSSAAPVPAAVPASNSPAGPLLGRPADVAPAAPASPEAPTPPIRLLAGDTLHLPASARTPGQMSPASIEMDLGLSAKRLGVTLPEEGFVEAANLVTTKGLSPVQAVQEVSSRLPTPSAAPAVAKAPSLRVTRAEATEYARMLAAGKTDAEAAQSILDQRQLIAKTGATPPSKAARRVRQRNAAGPGGKWPAGTP